MNVSLDGYIETPDHSLDWTIADDELLACLPPPSPASDVYMDL